MAGEPPIASSERHRLAEAIRAGAGEIARRWMARVRADLPPASTVEPSQLVDGIYDYLGRLADAVEQDRPLERGGQEVWATVAREHAITRVRQGFDIDQLVHEFIVLRRTVWEVARESGALAPGERGEGLTELIEAAIARAVASYVESRDYEARRVEAEHVAFVTHELKNPLAAARLGIDRVRRLVAAGKSAAAVAAADDVDRSLGRLGELIGAVLTVEQLNAGAVDVHLADVALEALVDESTRGAAAAAAAKRIGMRVATPPEVAVRVDERLARSAIENVVDNAVKFTDEGDVEVRFDEDDRVVTIEVGDNCGGLSPEELEIIFLPFRRGATRKPGTGLGLAIARRAVEAFGGAIAAESAHERGCLFRLTLPKSPA